MGDFWLVFANGCYNGCTESCVDLINCRSFYICGNYSLQATGEEFDEEMEPIATGVGGGEFCLANHWQNCDVDFYFILKILISFNFFDFVFCMWIFIMFIITVDSCWFIIVHVLVPVQYASLLTWKLMSFWHEN